MDFSNLHCPMSYAVYKFQPEIGEFSACCDANAYNFDETEFDKLGDYYFEKFPKLINRKESLLNDIKHNDCVQCWKKEQQGLTSMRMVHGPQNPHLYDRNIDTSKAFPNRIELWMNSTCNLGCFMCHLGNSNTLRKIWYNDYDTFGHDGRGFEDFVVNNNYYRNYKSKFIQSMLNFTKRHISECKTMLCIAYLGGEPTLHNEMFEHADEFIDAGREAIKSGVSLEIEITTNGTGKPKLNKRVYKMFEKYKAAGWKIRIMLSQDAAEDYVSVRHGADFNQISQNFGYWISPESPIDVVTSFTVVSGLNLPYMDTMAKYIDNTIRKNFTGSKRLTIAFNTLVDPNWMQINYLPRKYATDAVKEANMIFDKLKIDYPFIAIQRSLFDNITSNLPEEVSKKDAEYFFEKLIYVNNVYKKTYPDWDFFNTFPHLQEYANEYGIKI